MFTVDHDGAGPGPANGLSPGSVIRANRTLHCQTMTGDQGFFSARRPVGWGVLAVGLVLLVVALTVVQGWVDAPSRELFAPVARPVIVQHSVTLAQPVARSTRAAISTATWVKPRPGMPNARMIATVARSGVEARIGQQGWWAQSTRVTSLGTRGSTAEVVVQRSSDRARAVVFVNVVNPNVRVGKANPWSVKALSLGADPATIFSTRTSIATVPDIGGNQDLGAIVGRGSILLPGDFSGDPTIRNGAVNCVDCEWRRRPDCLDAAIDTLCAGVTFGCPVGQIRYQILLRRPPDPWFSVVGTICMGPGEVLRSPDDIARTARDSFIELLPRAHPSYQPANGALVNLPAIFAANEPTEVGPIYRTLSGYRVRITASAQWRWRFGDGQSLVTASPGGRYPNTSVRHTYLSDRSRTVRLTTSWTGEFSVDGQGPFLIAGGPIRLGSSVAVKVRPATAQLITSN